MPPHLNKILRLHTHSHTFSHTHTHMLVLALSLSLWGNKRAPLGAAGSPLKRRKAGCSWARLNGPFSREQSAVYPSAIMLLIFQSLFPSVALLLLACPPRQSCSLPLSPSLSHTHTPSHTYIQRFNQSKYKHIHSYTHKLTAVYCFLLVPRSFLMIRNGL